MVFLVLFSFVVMCVANSDSLLLEPRERCVPTARTYRPCHVCVCGVEGQYHCRAHTCQEEAQANDYEGEMNQECEPNRTYREDVLFCTCSANGFWKSTNCRKKFGRIEANINHPLQKLRTNVACTPGSLVLIDCNICECSQSGMIELAYCTNRRCKNGHKANTCSYGDILRTNNELCSCSDINLYIDRLCFKVFEETSQEISRTDVESIIDIGKTWMRTNDIYKNACVPKTVLRVDCNTCTCTDIGVPVCTDKHCLPPNSPKKEVIRSQKTNVFFSLPQLKSEDSPCEPEMQYRYKCNSCICSYKGIPSCTKMICLEDLVLDKKALEASYADEQGLSNANDEIINE